MRPCQSRRVRITCTPPDSRRPVWFVWWALLPAPWNHVQGNCEDSLSLSLSLCCDQGWVSKFSLCQGSFSYQLQQETRVYFLPDLVYIFPKNYIKQRLTLSILSVDDYIYPEKILLTSKFFFVFCFIFFGGETPPIHLTETGTANSWETTNSKPPGPIIMITN